MVYHLHSFFADEPFAQALKVDKRGTKALAEVCKRLSDLKEREEKDTIAATHGFDIIEEGQKARRMAVTAEARQAMAAKMASRGEKRTLSLR